MKVKCYITSLLGELNISSQELMAGVNVLHLVACKVKHLTKGQRKLVAMAIALSSSAVVSIIEEPLRGLRLDDIPLVRQLSRAE